MFIFIIGPMLGHRLPTCSSPAFKPLFGTFGRASTSMLLDESLIVYRTFHGTLILPAHCT
jgi:hypothetical protein